MKNLIHTHLERWFPPAAGGSVLAEGQLPVHLPITEMAHDCLIWLTIVSVLLGIWLQVRALKRGDVEPLPEPEKDEL